jgi:hypothetical protein
MVVLVRGSEFGTGLSPGQWPEVSRAIEFRGLPPEPCWHGKDCLDDVRVLRGAGEPWEEQSAPTSGRRSAELRDDHQSVELSAEM